MMSLYEIFKKNKGVLTEKEISIISVDLKTIYKEFCNKIDTKEFIIKSNILDIFKDYLENNKFNEKSLTSMLETLIEAFKLNIKNLDKKGNGLILINYILNFENIIDIIFSKKILPNANIDKEIFCEFLKKYDFKNFKISDYYFFNNKKYENTFGKKFELLNAFLSNSKLIYDFFSVDFEKKSMDLLNNKNLLEYFKEFDFKDVIWKLYLNNEDNILFKMEKSIFTKNLFDIENKYLIKLDLVDAINNVFEENIAAF